MREAAYRAMLRQRLGAASIDSYVAYCGRVEATMGADLDTLDLTDDGLAALRRRMVQDGVVGKSIDNCMTALRRYRTLPGA